MTERPLEDLVDRLERARLDADRIYNDALTAVDRAVQRTPELPKPPRPYDEDRVTPINGAWRILPDAPSPTDRSLKGRLRSFIWRMVGPPLEAQQRFNAELVDHINRNVAAHRDDQAAVVRLIDVAREQFDSLVRFESLLVQYLQTITLYVDTKDRRTGATELTERVGLLEQRLLALKREMERLPRLSPLGEQPESQPATSQPFDATLDAPTYVGFEDRYRGSQRDIRGRLEDYLPIFRSASNVLDVGCGRGELLDLLRQQGITARGVDSNDAMVQLCRARGLEVERGDALEFLERQRDGSLGGLVAIQVVEHFEPRYLIRFLEAAYHKLEAGAPLALETINPACWMAFFECYIRDVTHRQALHPDTLRYLVQSSGFTHVDVQYRSPVGDGDRLERVADADVLPAADRNASLAIIASVVNAHADKLNARLFSSMDYAVVAKR